jgi:beta-mannosidase
MRRIDLDGDWQLVGFPEGDLSVEHPDDLPAEGVISCPARVPGNVELDLERAGIIPDPFFGANMRLLRAYEAHEWWFLRELDLPAGAADRQLVFEGLDTFATVWLNGVEVGRSDNMLIEHRFDVSEALRPGATNRIAVRIRPALSEARRYEYDAVDMSWEMRDECQHVRKAAHMYGWDIMPRFVSAGIWRPVRLEEREPTAFEQLYYYTAGVRGDGAALGVKYQFRTDARLPDGFSLRFSGRCGDHTFETERPVEFIAGGLRIHVPGARLWWPRGYGEPDLYTVTCELLHDRTVVAERTDRVGLRTVEVDRTDAAGGVPPSLSGEEARRVDTASDPDGHFVFRVNGVPIMVKGSNWVPLDAFHSRDAERLDGAMALFDDLGCNMVRCWGGSVYESDRFFDLCDEKGMLVWQDFAFACNRYPQTEEFLAVVRCEAEATVKRLRNHACLAIWCGDNEIDAAYAGDGLSPEHNRISREVLPQVVHRCDPFRHYVPSSPYQSPAAPDGRTPEQHLWGPRGYFKAPFYTDHTAHFIGEIGYHGCPNVSSIERFISPDALWSWQDNDEWQVHSTYHFSRPVMHRDRIGLMARQIEELFGEIPGDLESFALASQITQAEAKKFFIESTRLRKWHTSGILWWNVLDGWPQFSDAIVDYYFGRKLAYHYIRRVQQPVCVIVGEADGDGSLPVVVANDTRGDAEVAYEVSDQASGLVAIKGTLNVPAGENWLVGQISSDAPRLFLITWQTGGRAFGNHYVTGGRPFSLDRYRAWLPAIAALPGSFEAESVAR